MSGRSASHRCMLNKIIMLRRRLPSVPIFLKIWNKSLYTIVVIDENALGDRSVKDINDIVSRFKRGDEKAFEGIYERFSKKVFNLALRYCQEEAAAEDITQETFIRVFRHIDSFNEEYSFGAWLMKIAVNLCISYRKEHWKDAQKIIKYQEVKRTAAENPAAKAETEDAIAYYLGQMDSVSRTMMILYYLQDFTYEEISKILDCPIGTVKSRLSRARERFHEMVSKKKEGNVQ